MLDIATIISDLISASPKLLGETSLTVFFERQFSPSSALLTDLLIDHDNYAFCIGQTSIKGPPPLNWSAAGLVAEDELALSHIPKGTVTWEEMPNVLLILEDFISKIVRALKWKLLSNYIIILCFTSLLFYFVLVEYYYQL
jgi:hypothetical protein